MKKKSAKKKTPTKKVETEEPEKKISSLWIVLIGIVLLAAIVWIVRITAVPSSYEHNGYLFTQIKCPDTDVDCWETNIVTNVGVHPVTFYYGPRDIGDVIIEKAAIERVFNLTEIQDSSLTIAFDEGVPGEVGLAAVQIARITGVQLFNINTKGALYGRDVTCFQSNRKDAVLYITQASETAIVLEDDCVLVLAKDSEDLRKVADAFTLNLIGIVR